jgi:spore germination cell wall hydrolase CwlJ-like protein
VSSAGAPSSAVSSAPPTPMAAAQRLMATLAKSEARGRPSSSNLMTSDDLG